MVTPDRPAFRPRTLAETVADQEDLDALCAPRPVPPTEEPYPWNTAYGHDRIIKEYAGLPASYRLRIAMPHGVSYGKSSMFVPRESVPVLGYVREEERRRYRDLGVRGRLWPMALPYVYLLDLLAAELTEPPVRQGTIFFPPHSGPQGAVVVDHQRIVAKLAELPAERHPVTVCVYHEDHHLGLHRPYLEAGFRVVSAGHSYDPVFLSRLHHLFTLHPLDEPVFVLTCDNVTDLDFGLLSDDYEALGSPTGLLVGVRPVSGLEGDYIFHVGPRVTEIDRHRPSEVYSSGIQVLNPGATSRLCRPAEDFYGIWNQLIAADRLRLSSVRPERWLTVDTVADLDRLASGETS